MLTIFLFVICLAPTRQRVFFWIGTIEHWISCVPGATEQFAKEAFARVEAWEESFWLGGWGGWGSWADFQKNVAEKNQKNSDGRDPPYGQKHAVQRMYVYIVKQRLSSMHAIVPGWTDLTYTTGSTQQHRLLNRRKLNELLETAC